MNPGSSIRLFVLLGTCTTFAAWQAVETFESLSYGALNGRNGWTASPEAYVVNDGFTEKTGSIANHGPLSSYDYMRKQCVIPNRTTATVFFTFLVTTNPVRQYVGFSDRTAPGGEYDCSGNVRLDKGGQTGARFEFGVDDGGSYDGLRVLTAGTWYAVWMVIRNGAASTQEHYDVYQTTELSEPGIGSIVFSNAGFPHVSGSISTICAFAQAQMPTGTSMPVWIDNIYVDRAGVNLSNPTIPEPVAAAMVLLLYACIARRR